MGWASDYLEYELARSGIYPIQNSNSYETSYDYSEPKEKPLVTNKRSEKFDNLVVYFIKYGEGNHIATFNVYIKNLIKIKYVRLFLNKNTGEYYLSFPSIKCGDKYINCIMVNRELYNQILDDCLDILNQRGD